MKLRLFHGRLSPTQGGTDLEGRETGDWGFDGPVLEGVTGFSGTYGHLHIWFKDEDTFNAAQSLTGWEEAGELGLVVYFSENCIAIFNEKRQREEFFGDWSTYDEQEG